MLGNEGNLRMGIRKIDPIWHRQNEWKICQKEKAPFLFRQTLELKQGVCVSSSAIEKKLKNRVSTVS